MRANVPGLIRCRNPELIDEVWHTFSGQWIRGRRNLEVQVRCARITGITDPGEYLAAPYAFSGLYQEAPRL